jgi:hypothetical protein
MREAKIFLLTLQSRLPGDYRLAIREGKLMLVISEKVMFTLEENDLDQPSEALAHTVIELLSKYMREDV